MPDAIAEKLVEEDRLDEAIARLEEVVEKTPEPGLELRLASLQHLVGKYGDALAHARRVAGQESPHQADALLLVAYCLRSVKRWRESSRVFVMHAERWPESGRARVARFTAALCLEELDDWGGAIEIYAVIGDDEADFRRALCLERAGRPDEAIALFEEFIARHAESPEAIKVRFRIGALRLRQGRTDEAITHLTEAVRLGEETFIGQLAATLLERARTKAADVSRKLRKYDS
jgi:tetratricopeptide (TPR) repeat protein